MPKVTIVIPVYNTSKYLLRCLDSVRMQTLEDIEVIIINDGSTDNSAQICEDYIRNNGLDWKVYSKSNGGLSSARKYGWERSKGDYIVFIDSDDDILPDYCNAMYEAIIKTDSQLAICGYNLCSETTRIAKLPEVNNNIIEDIPSEYGKRLILDTSSGNRIPGFLWMRMMKRELITEECFINENKVYAEDQIFDLIYSKSVSRLVVVPEVLYDYYVNMGSLTLKYRPNMLEMTSNLQEFHYNYLKSNNLLDNCTTLDFAKYVLDGYIASAVNTFRFGHFRDVKDFMNKIRRVERYKESFKHLKGKGALTNRQKIWSTVINNRLSLITYLYYLTKRKS